MNARQRRRILRRGPWVESVGEELGLEREAKKHDRHWQLHLRWHRPCPSCKGHGIEASAPDYSCHKCKGHCWASKRPHRKLSPFFRCLECE